MRSEARNPRRPGGGLPDARIGAGPAPAHGGEVTWVSLVGAVPIVVALRDIFHTLFHPAGSGSVGRAVQRVTWRVFRILARRRPQALALAGPTAVVAVIGSWAFLAIVGWALVYWPQLPGGFHFASGVPATDGFGEALYVSLVTLSTLGYGDVTPASVG